MISIEIEAICRECGTELSVMLTPGGIMSDLKIQVKPCPSCYKKATNQEDQDA